LVVVVLAATLSPWPVILGIFASAVVVRRDVRLEELTDTHELREQQKEGVRVFAHLRLRRPKCAVVHAEKSALRFDSNAEAANSYYNAARAVAALVAPVYEPDGWPNFSKWYDMLKTARDSISA